MPPLPPVELVLEIALQGLLVPIMVALVVATIGSRLLGRRGELCCGLVAVILGFLAGNVLCQAVDFRLDSERPLAITDFVRAAVVSAVTTDGTAQVIPPARYWLPWVAMLGGGVGLLYRMPRMPVFAVWMLRVATAMLISRLLVAPSVRSEISWLWPAVSAVLLLNAWVLDELGKEANSRWLSLGMVWMLFSAATVLIHAHTARMTDLATILAGCWIGVAVIAWWRPAAPITASGLPLTAVALPGLMLIGQQSTFSEVPLASFVLLACVPTALAPVLLFPTAKRSSWIYIATGWILILVPTLLAIILAVRAEELSFE